jgi:hypothetical protein
MGRFAQTDMGNAGARFYGMEKAYTPVEEAVAGGVKAVSNMAHPACSMLISPGRLTPRRVRPTEADTSPGTDPTSPGSLHVHECITYRHRSSTAASSFLR